MNTESRLMYTIGFIGDDLISEAAEYRPAAKKTNKARILRFTAAGCAAAAMASVFTVFAVRSMNNVTSDKSPVVSGNIPNSASVGTNVASSGSDHSARALEEWLNDPAVVWSGEPLKGDFDGFGESVPLGMAMISEKWLPELSESPNETVYAVMVDFMSCIDNTELESWEHNGDTVASLKSELNGYFFDTGKTMPVSYIKDGEWYTEYIPVYNSNPEDADKIAELEMRIEEITSVYYGMKIESFRDSFSANGLGVYDLPFDDGLHDNRCFYTFATREQLENFKCKANEAFFFMPAFRLK